MTRLLTAFVATAVALAAQAPPPLPIPALHHVGLNVVDPAASQRFYKTLWPQGEITTVAGLPAYRSDMSLLFTKVNQPADGRFDLKEHRSLHQSPLWHIGFETQTPTATLKERLTAARATIVPMYSSDKDTTGTLWRAGEMGYGRNPIVTAKMMALTLSTNLNQETKPGTPQRFQLAITQQPLQRSLCRGRERRGLIVVIGQWIVRRQGVNAAHEVPGDPAQVRPQPSAHGVEVGGVGEQMHEHVLSDVGGDRRRTGPEQREVVHHCAMALVERPQCGRCAATDALEQFGVARVLGGRGGLRHRALVLGPIRRSAPKSSRSKARKACPTLP